MKRFGSERIKDMLDRLQVADDELDFTSRMITRQVETAQKRVEGNKVDTRKNTLQYDDVMREQREDLVKQRLQIIHEDETRLPVLMAMINRTNSRIVTTHTTGDTKDWNLDALYAWNSDNMADPEKLQRSELDGQSTDEHFGLLADMAENNFQHKKQTLGDDAQMSEFEKVDFLRVVDTAWTELIDAMDTSRQ